MGEKKRRKQLLGSLLAFTMLVTQLGVWNAGKESVQAAETNVYTADFSDYSVEDWTYNWSSTTDDTTFQAKWNDGLGNNDAALSIWTKTAQKLDMTHLVSNLEAGDYYVSAKTNGEGLTSGTLAITSDSGTQSTEILFEKANESAEYKTENALTVSTGETVTISISMDLKDGGYGYLDDITLTKADNSDSGDTDEYAEKTLYFKYTGNGIPAIQFWNKCDENLLPAKEQNTVEIDGSVYYCMEKVEGKNNWYEIDLKYKKDGISNKDVGFDLNEISSDETTKTGLKSYDAYWGADGVKQAYNNIFNDTYADPAIIEDDYENVVSYAEALAEEENEQIVSNASVNVKKVQNLDENFIMGMDISSMISELESGVVYRDYDGNELATLDDICKFIKEQGINHIRIRVWNDPYDANGNGYGGGNNDVAKAKQFADACRNAGLKMLVDFHCSDLWTDPSKQQVPKAWKGYTLEQKKEALNTYITESLNTIDPTKDVVDMVQVGNETTGGFIGESNVSNMCVLFSAGATGVKSYNPDVKVVIHVESPHKGTVVTWAKNLQDNAVDYDIIATSYYPYWHGTLDNLKKQFTTVKNTYHKDVMVAETSYAYTLEDSDGHTNTVRVGNNDDGADTTEPFTEQGQATAIRNLINTVNEAGGLGVFYWEPAWLTVGNTKGLTGDAYDAQVKANKEKWEKYGSGWASSYAGEYDAEDAGKWYGGSAVDNEAMFYPDGTATPALHVWNYVKTGAVSNLVSVEGFDSALSQSITAGSSFTLPDTVAVTYSDDKTPVAETVVWKDADVQKADASKTGTYQISGTISLSKEITRGAYKGKNSADVTFTLEVTTPNLITNEDVSEINPSAQDLFEVTGDGVFKDIANSENPKSGATCMSWWSTTATTETVTYKEAITLEKGTYTFEAYAQGAQADVTMQILDTNDQVLATGDAAELTGWKDWKTPKVTFTLDKTTAIKLRVSVGIQESGWGSFDVLYLHEEKKDTTEENGNGSSSGSTGGTTSGSTGGTTSGSTTGGTTAGTGSSTAEGTTETPTPAPSDPAASDLVNVVTVKTESGENVQAAVNVQKDASGNVTKATATITDTKAVLSADVAAKLAEAAGTDSISIKAEVTDADGNTKYTVAVDAKNLVADKKLKVVAIDKKTGAYKLVNAKTYQVGKDGNLDLNLADGADYQLLTPAETKAVEKAILKTVTVDKKSATVKKGKTTKIQLSKKLDQDNVKKITYVSGKKSVATVSKNGKITAKGKGTVTVKAKVTLNNGTTKTVSMKIKVK